MSTGDLHQRRLVLRIRLSREQLHHKCSDRPFSRETRPAGERPYLSASATLHPSRFVVVYPLQDASQEDLFHKTIFVQVFDPRDSVYHLECVSLVPQAPKISNPHRGPGHISSPDHHPSSSGMWRRPHPLRSARIADRPAIASHSCPSASLHI